MVEDIYLHGWGSLEDEINAILNSEDPINRTHAIEIARIKWNEIAEARAEKASNQPPARMDSAQAAINRVAIDLDNNPEYPSIRRVNIKAQAGVSGYAVEHMGDDGPPIVFRADWYKGKGYKPDKMLALRVTGESMIPSLYEGDLIVINTEQTQPKQGLPFLVSYEGEVVVKRMVRDDGLWWLTSDNPDQRRYPRTKCNGETQIIGEVVYRQTERI